MFILALAWAGLFAVAAFPGGARLFGHELARSEIAELWAAPEIHAEPLGSAVARASAPSWFSATPAAEPSARPVVDPAAQRILILGDSMIEGLLPRLADYAAENGHSVNAVIWYGSRTIDWAHGSRLTDALRDYRPTFVIVVVGSSELTTRDIEKRASAVEAMLKAIGERKLMWVGPPNWRTDTGIGALLEREVGTERYFRSADLTFERNRDGVHPTLASAKRWMDAIADWNVKQSGVPIRFDVPQKTGTPRPSVRVFAPPTQ